MTSWRTLNTVRQSPLFNPQGFGSWKPSKGAIGSSVWGRMNFYGDHATILEDHLQKGRFSSAPAACSFASRMRRQSALTVHSDVHDRGYDLHCSVFNNSTRISTVLDFIGTRRFNSLFMPTLDELAKASCDIRGNSKADINESSEKLWEEVGEVGAKASTTVLFAKLHKPSMASRNFHIRGFGIDENTELANDMDRSL